MKNVKDIKSLSIIISVFLFVIIATYFVSLAARGYRLGFNQGSPTVNATGLLSVTSKPKSASVYINNRLITATDDTINLPPEEYTVKIAKDGYTPWEKKVHIKKETVFLTDAQLFRSVPDLKPLTVTGAINPAVSPDGLVIVYAVASASASIDNGLYQLQLADNPLPLNPNAPKKIFSNLPYVDWSKFTFAFSPDSRSFLASNKTTGVNYLISLDSSFNANNLFDVTARLSIIASDWQRQSEAIIANRTEKLPSALHSLVATESAKYIQLSSTEDKVLYLAATDGNLADNLISPPPAQSTQNQSRQIKKGYYYVYDIKDDTNFLIGPKETVNNPLWLNNSANIIFVNNSEIKAIEYDATNSVTLFAGNFDTNTVAAWADGNKIVALTSPYSKATPNLYSITIR